MTARPQYCDNCAEPIGTFERPYREFTTCGAPACERERRDQERGADDEAREAAERDGYERYR